MLFSLSEISPLLIKCIVIYFAETFEQKSRSSNFKSFFSVLFKKWQIHPYNEEPARIMG